MKNLKINSYKLPKELRLSHVEKEFSAKFNHSLDGSYYISLENGSKYIFYYKFNVIVFFGLTDEEINFRLTNLATAIWKEKFNTEIRQDAELIQNPKMKLDFLITEDSISLKKIDDGYIEVISIIIAQSVALEYYEIMIEQIFPKNASFYDELKRTGNFHMKQKDILQFWANILSIRHTIVNDLFLLDKPDVLWDEILLEKFYNVLYKFYDLHDRFEALEYKLDLMNGDIEFLNDIASYKHSSFLEWIIIFLILFEIFMSLWEKIFPLLIK